MEEEEEERGRTTMAMAPGLAARKASPTSHPPALAE